MSTQLSRIQAGVLEQGAVNMLDAATGKRMHAEGLVHNGLYPRMACGPFAAVKLRRSLLIYLRDFANPVLARLIGIPPENCGDREFALALA